MAAVIFLVVFILAAVLISDIFRPPVESQLRAESEKITETVASGVGPGAFLAGQEVDPVKITELLAVNYTDLRAIYGAQYDFCIYFEDQEGKIIMINGTSAGVGDPSVNVSGLPCGLNPGPGCDEDDDLYQNASTCGGTDCDDYVPFIHPGAPEVCNGLDDDCDTIVDEGCVACPDNDGDGYSQMGGACGVIDCCDLGTEGTLGCAVATRASIHPGAVDVCENGIDEDCSGADLAPCPPTSCTDDDGDGYSREGGACGPVDCCDLGTEGGLGCSVLNSPLINPGAVENDLTNCDDGIDQNCDGSDTTCLVTSLPALSCSWQAAVNCLNVDIGTQITLLKAQQTRNSHVGNRSSAYTYSVCCDINAPFTISHGCSAPDGAMPLRISGMANAHAQNNAAPIDYPVDICLNSPGRTTMCKYRAASTCAPDESCLLVMTAGTNSMIAACDTALPSPYVNSICCKVT